MFKKDTITLIVAFKECKDIEKDGHIIHFHTNSTIDTLRSLAAEKLSVQCNLNDVQLLDEEDHVIDTMDNISQQHVVFVDTKDPIIEVIPGPRKLPIVGSLYEMLPDLTEGWMRQFATYGPLVEVRILGKTVIGTNDPAIAELFVKESEYFTKKIGTGGLSEFKPLGGQGLFTTDTDDMDWKLAHKLLIPAFSSRAVKVYQTEMGILTQKLIKVFEQYSPTDKVDILQWATNITFETIGRIGFGYEFNMLSSPDQPTHPFIEAMNYCLTQAICRIQQAQFIKQLPIEANRRFDRSVHLMRDIVDNVIRQRKSDGQDANNDLLGYMLNARDQHDLGLSDENIRDQVVTFLIAGHDTTANTLAWTLYHLARNPEIERKLLQEIADNHICADEIPTHEQISNLKYMHQVLKETLRLHPPVRVLGKYCKKDCIVPGGYKVKAGDSLLVHVHCLHRNEKEFPDPEKFDPDRWTSEEEQKRSRFSWLPFSTGPRGCIGMVFALQEAKTVLSMLLYRFKFSYEGPAILADPKAATTKPADLFMTIHDRQDFPTTEASSPVSSHPTSVIPSISYADASAIKKVPPITFLYGTQTGSAQDYASQMFNQAKSFGFQTCNMYAMDQWPVLDQGRFVSNGADNKPYKEVVVICTATYNGQPPDSAEKFNKFLDDKVKEEDHESVLDGLSYAVFGLGNKNWRTYQHFPIKVNSLMEELGAHRLFAGGQGDADKDMDAEFNNWCAHFWAHVMSDYGITVSGDHSIVPSASIAANSLVKVKFVQPRDKESWNQAALNRNREHNSILLVNKELQSANSPRNTRHIEVDISNLSPVGENGILYHAGDHIEIMPENDMKLVEKVALGFGWILDSVFTIDPESISGVSSRTLAANIKGPCTIRNMLCYYADITSPPSRAVLSGFAAQLKKTDPDVASLFESIVSTDISSENAYTDFIQKHRTLSDLQEAYPQVNHLGLNTFLTSVAVIQPRRYSIASSPLVHPTTAHLTVGVVDDDVNGKHYPGLASSYLANSVIKSSISAALKSAKDTFNMPEDPMTPIIMIGAGTGLAPFRGFLQERKAQLEKYGKIGKAILFFGCRRSDMDYIYRNELEQYVKEGVLNNLYPAFSRNQEKSPIRYVQHQLLVHAQSVWDLIYSSDKNASIYVCGSGAMSKDVRCTFIHIAHMFGVGETMEESEHYIFSLIENKSYKEDVWG
ncbi:cytochrome P450 [Pilobolus umbonatus]|nr:cytochrome P450 [Pilobolus umbonatus]